MKIFQSVINKNVALDVKLFLDCVAPGGNMLEI